MEYHEETILYPKCGKVQTAKVEHTAPFYSYVHECDEWDKGYVQFLKAFCDLITFNPNRVT